MDLDKEFNKNTYKSIKDGQYAVNCKKGLWGVTASTREEVMREARHYFIQYYMDGEYDDNKDYANIIEFMRNAEK